MPGICKYSTSSSSSYHGAGSLFAPFRSHTSRSFFKWSVGFHLPVVPQFLVFSTIYGVFCLYVANNFFCIRVFYSNRGLCLVLLQCLCLFMICPSVSCCISHTFHPSCCYYSSCISSFNGPIFTTV